MINLKASKKTGTINVGVSPITNINLNNPAISDRSATPLGGCPPPGTVQYPPPINIIMLRGLWGSHDRAHTS